VVGFGPMIRAFTLACVLALLGCEAAPEPGRHAEAVSAAVTPTGPAVDVDVRSIVRAERAAHPDAFELFDRIVREWLDRRDVARNEALLSRGLRDLGDAGVGPMLDAVAGTGFAQPLDARTQAAMHTALVEALGRIEDPRALPALRAIFERAEQQSVRTVAARAIARTCGDLELDLLLAHAEHAHPNADAAIEGLGRCLRLPAAERLVALHESAQDPARKAAIASALRRISSDLVWRAPSRRNDPEGAEIRKVVARALGPR